MSLLRGSRQEGREAATLATSRPGRFLLAVVFLVPGGLLIAAGVLLAVSGAALVAAALRRLPATPLASVPAPELEHDAGDARHPLAAGRPPIDPAGRVGQRTPPSTGREAGPAHDYEVH